MFKVYERLYAMKILNACLNQSYLSRLGNFNYKELYGLSRARKAIKILCDDIVTLNRSTF